MTATYQTIDRPEFEDFMAEYDAERVDVPGTRELVYDIETDVPKLPVRVFSSISRTGKSRDAGKDAIRVTAWSNVADKPIAKEKRTHRIDTWRENLSPKVESMIQKINDGDVVGAETYLDALPEGSADDSVIVSDFVETEYGRKILLDSPYDAKDAIKALDWDTTHRTWDKVYDGWTIDATPESVEHTIATLAGEGWPLRLPDTSDIPIIERVDVEPGDDIVVTYGSKTSGSELEKTGTVTGFESGRVEFRRDDGQPMYITDDDELFTARSAYPFVGEVVDIAVE